VRRALILGGGGLAGIAWHAGVLLGLADAGVDVLDADIVVGTSAGSVVSSQVLGGVSLEELFAAQTEDAPEELRADFSVQRMIELFGPAVAAAQDTPGRRRAIGGVALAAEVMAPDQRRGVIASRLVNHEWPAGRDLRITVVNARTGEPAVFDRDSGVTLLDAVSASCAVPGIYPVVEIDGEPWMDGGVRSYTNADLVIGEADAVLVLAPLAQTPGMFGREIDAAMRDLESAADVVTITPDAAAQAAIGLNPLDPDTREPSARAGRAQGAAAADAVRSLWG
jgi:NTE family protein